MTAVIGIDAWVRDAHVMPLPPGLAAWTSDETVGGFARALPNDVLMRFAQEEHRARGGGLVVDIGCGAGRNAVPLALMGWDVLGTDLSWPMLAAARGRAQREAPGSRLLLAHAPMESLPAPDASADLVIAHGIWNLAESAITFRSAVAEAARIAKPGAGLFVFTFSRHTLSDEASPVPGEAFVFTQFSGRPQVFLTPAQLNEEMARARFVPDAAVPLTEYNRRPPAALSCGGPVIYEAAFRRC